MGGFIKVLSLDEINSSGSFSMSKEKIFEEVMRVEIETWPAEIMASLEKFITRANVFPQGFLLGFAVFSGDEMELQGVCTTEIIDFDPGKKIPSWETITDDGETRKSHKPKGNALYVVSIGVSPLATRGIGSELLTGAKKLAKNLGLDYIVLGSRVPGFNTWHRKNPERAIEDYLKIRYQDDSSIDPLIRFFERNGFEIIEIKPKYMNGDVESEEYGVVMMLHCKRVEN